MASMVEFASNRTDLQVEPIARITLQQKIYRQVADLILNGEIAPGELVTIQALADAFGVSTMPVREALIRLTAAGALTMVTGRSMGIPRLSTDQLKDLRNVRMEVEGVAAGWASARIDADQIKQIETQCDALKQAVAAGDIKAYLRLNRLFHFSVYEIAQSPTLVALIETLWLRISPYFNLLHGSGNYIISNEHHRELLQALKNGNPTSARKAVHADIQDAYAVLAELLG
jgi:DNA-binding GntR family transcriptional regulator